MSDFSDKLRNIGDLAVDRAPDALATLVLGLVLVEVIVFVISRILSFTKLPAGLKKVAFSLLRAFLFIVLFVAVIQALGLNNVFVALTGGGVIAALLISTGIAPLVTDIIAGLFLGGDRQFQPGATVKAGSNGTEGVIQTMDLRKIYIRDKQGRDHVLPNAMVEKNEWVILKKAGSTKRRR